MGTRQPLPRTRYSLSVLLSVIYVSLFSPSVRLVCRLPHPSSTCHQAHLLFYYLQRNADYPRTRILVLTKITQRGLSEDRKVSVPELGCAAMICLVLPLLGSSVWPPQQCTEHLSGMHAP